MIALFSLALATTGFDPTTPAARYTGEETWTQDGVTHLWSAIERLEDPDRTLFHQENFNDSVAWPDESDWAPWIDDCFESTTPGSWSALLHMGPNEEFSTGTPILFVPGAGDNGSRGFITMLWHMDLLYRPSYALTFAHPHGDAFQQAEMIANAIARIKERTGASQVDVVSHSKGGMATALYLSHTAGATWSNEAYNTVGTPYRGDVRRAVFIATPLDGIDTGFRWPLGNLYSLDAETALSPSSWRTWYPYTTTNPYVTEDLSAQDFLSGDEDFFPGHRQLLKRQAPDLPGSLSWLGVYALQPDWYTTYEGGFGYQSYSDGIDAAVEDGDYFIGQLAIQGVDPAVELYLLAGENPIMPNGSGDYLAAYFDGVWLDIYNAGSAIWGEFVADLIEDGLVSVGFTESDIQGLAAGNLVLGEISGPSDGLVFVDSATHGETLTGRGAVVHQTKVANLSHLDLLYASPITGQLLKDEALADPEYNGWMEGVGDRYIEADTIGWVEEVLADEATPGDTGDTGEPGGDSGTKDSGTPDDTGTAPSPTDDTAAFNDEKDDLAASCACNGGGVGGLGLPALMGLLLVRRRRSYSTFAKAKPYTP